MSDDANSENLKDPHSALESLWPSDSAESKKLAEEKQQKRQNLVDLGNKLKDAREALGYNISDLDEHTGLSYQELEALEQGNFNQIEQQDYVDYYVHTYAALLGLNADEMLSEFKQNFYQTDEPVPAETTDLRDEEQYEDAFADEAKKTIKALEASGVNVLQAVNPNPQNPAPETTNEPELTATAQTSDPHFSATAHSTADYQGKNITVGDLSAAQDDKVTPAATAYLQADSQPAAIPWLKVALAAAIVIILALGIYLISTWFTATPNSGGDDNNTLVNNVKTNPEKVTDRVPQGQKAKKIGQLESTIIKQGSDDLNAPTADIVHEPLVLLNQKSNVVDKITDTATEVVNDAAKGLNNIIKQVVDSDAVAATDDLAKATELANAAKATQDAVKQAAEAVPNDATAETAPKFTPKAIQETTQETTQETAPAEAIATELPEDPIQEALAQLPEDSNKYSLHANKNSWVLLEDDGGQIILSGELTPEKIITLPKIDGVIISLVDAGVIDVYKGKQLIGKLGAADESLDLVLVADRFNQISN